jgi:hypothetical protein
MLAISAETKNSDTRLSAPMNSEEKPETKIVYKIKDF